MRNKAQFCSPGWSFMSRSVFSSLSPTLSLSLSSPLRLLRAAYLSLTYILFSSFTSLFFAHSILLIHSHFSETASRQTLGVPERQRSCPDKLHIPTTRKAAARLICFVFFSFVFFKCLDQDVNHKLQVTVSLQH